jgi:glycosyltransferase involved in cell wall biosynthesis
VALKFRNPWRSAGARPAGHVTGSKRLFGHIDGPPDTTTLSGWLAEVDNPNPRSFTLMVDGAPLFAGVANRQRQNIRQGGFGSGRYGFKLSPPPHLLDNRKHVLELIDDETRIVVTRCKRRLVSAARFDDFDDWCRIAIVDPIIQAPFLEPAKRVFATMEGIRKHLCREVDRAKPDDLVSIVMPAFNRADLIGAAIATVLRQTYPNFELIVVDDGSTDATVDVVKSFRDDRVRLIALPENGGAAVARNVALAAARGSIVTYLDTDNRIAEDFLCAIVGAFTLMPDADALYCAQAIYDGDEAAPSAVRFAPLNRSLLRNRNYVDLGAFAHRRAVIDAVGTFDPELRRAQDWDFVMRVVERCRVVSVPAILSYYHRNLAGNALTDDARSVPHLERVRKRALERMEARSGRVRPLAAPVSIVIPNFEALSDLRECLDALHAHHSPAEIEVIIVDNLSSEDTRAFLRELDRDGRAKVVLNDENLGFTGAVNIGIARAAPGRDVIVMNNDAIVTASALAAMQETALADPGIAVVVPQQLLPPDTPTVTTHVPYAEPTAATDVNLSAHHRNVLSLPLFHDGGQLDLTFAPFFCVYLRRDALDALGGLDAEFGRHYRSDRLYCNAVRFLLGRRIVYTPDAVVHHKVQVCHQASPRFATGRGSDDAPAEPVAVGPGGAPRLQARGLGRVAPRSTGDAREARDNAGSCFFGARAQRKPASSLREGPYGRSFRQVRRVLQPHAPRRRCGLRQALRRLFPRLPDQQFPAAYRDAGPRPDPGLDQ